MSFENITSSNSPLKIFFEADFFIQFVILLLVFASLYSWSVIFARMAAIAIERQKIRTVVKILGSVETLDELRELAASGNGKIHEILHSLANEWKWSSKHAGRDYGDIRLRLAAVSELISDHQYTQLAGNSAWLATIGNSAPYFGLLGTVWGIMDSLLAISMTQTASLSVVAPGMAEALFATAVALLCAIPASIGYNRIVQALATTDQEWRAAASRVEVAISRHYAIIR